jgi:hypothetical protein
MADHIACPPVHGCGCYVCTKRRAELAKAARLELEMLGNAYAESLRVAVDWRIGAEWKTRA